MALIKLNNRSSEDTAIHGRRNLIINGAMQVWQRGTGAITSPTNGFLGVDRWKFGFTGPTFSSQQETLTSSDSPYNLGFRKYMRLTNTSTASSGSELVQMYQNMEGQNIAQSGWDYTSPSSYLTFSFWSRSSLAGTYYVRFQTNPSGGTNRQYSVPFTLSADTWTKTTISVPGNSSLEISDDNENRFSVFVIAHYGTNYSDPTVNDEEWRLYPDTTALVGTDFLQNFKNTNNATFDITGLQLESGDTATPFEHLSYGEELALCQRYFQIHENIQMAAYVNAAYRRAESYLALPTAMRATPSINTLTEGNSSNIRSPATTYSGLQMGLSKGGVNVHMESNGSGYMYFNNRKQSLDAEL